MAINFPDNPTLNDTYTYNGKTWKWNGSAWEKSSATETGNTEGNTGEVAYYGAIGSVIKGATAFLYDDTSGIVSFNNGLSAGGGATFGGDVNFLGNAIVATGGYLQWPDGTTQGTTPIQRFYANTFLENTSPYYDEFELISNSGDIAITTLGSSNRINYIFSLGTNVPKKDEQNVFTHEWGNVFETPVGSNRYTGNSGLETTLAATDHASATYMGVTSGTVNFKILGTDILDMDSDIHAYVGISADAGATFGGNVVVQGGATFANDINVNDLTIGHGGGDISTNTALGEDALVSNTEGEGNVASGYQSLYSNTEGEGNVASGYQSLYSNTEGEGNVASGYRSLYYNTTGYNNVASGNQSLYSNTTGHSNVAYGSRSLYYNTTGHSNVAYGSRSFQYNTTGYYNVASGNQSLYSNTTGHSNVASGYRSLYYNTTGYNNSALGYYAGYNGTTGSNNTYIGYNAQPSHATASNEIVLGDSNVTLIHSVAGMSMGGGATFGGNVNITGSGNYLQFPDGTTQSAAARTYVEEIIGINVDNGTSVLTTGVKGHRVLPYDCEVTEWTVTSINALGAIQWDVNWASYANFPNGLASVAGSDLPNIAASGNKNQDTTVGWTKTTFSAGDILQFEIDSVTTLTNCNLAIKIRRTS